MVLGARRKEDQRERATLGHLPQGMTRSRQPMPPIDTLPYYFKRKAGIMDSWVYTLRFPLAWDREDIARRVFDHWTGTGMTPGKANPNQISFKGACGKKSIGVTVTAMFQFLPKETTVKLRYEPSVFYQIISDEADAADFKAATDAMTEECERVLQAWAAEQMQ